MGGEDVVGMGGADGRWWIGRKRMTYLFTSNRRQVIGRGRANYVEYDVHLVKIYKGRIKEATNNNNNRGVETKRSRK